MKINTYSILMLALLAAGCSSVKTQVDTGPISARTFHFVPSGPRELPAYAEKRAELHAMIQQAIVNNLAAKGLRQVSQGGDVMVAYLVIAGNNAATTSLNEHFGYTADAAALVDKIHTEQAIKSAERGYFEAGTLVIDFVNPQTSKLIKRTMVQSQILRNLPADVRQARLQAFVDQAFSDLRVATQ